MLTDEREDHCGQVRLEREARYESLMKWGVFGEKNVQRDFNPSRLRPLSRMV